MLANVTAFAMGVTLASVKHGCGQCVHLFFGARGGERRISHNVCVGVGVRVRVRGANEGCAGRSPR